LHTGSYYYKHCFARSYVRKSDCPGGTEEYGLMVSEMMEKYSYNKFIAVGFSMGANIVMKYLGEHEEIQSRFIGAISCCQGYDVLE